MILSFQELQSTSMDINLTLRQSYRPQDLAIFQVVKQNLLVGFIQNVLQHTKYKTRDKKHFLCCFH